MDRLTKHSSSFICNSSNCIIAKCEQCENRLPSCYEEDCNATVAIVDRLAYFEDLQEQGRLVELPCKFGDMVWTIQENRCCTFHDLDFFTIVERHLEPSMIFYFGKTIFLTKAEAQAALVRMEGQK